MVKDQLLRVFPVEGVGSGVIIDKKGYILTNNHVIEKANKLKVTTTDGNIYDGTVIGTDPITDLAIIQTARPSCRTRFQNRRGEKLWG